MKGMKIAFDFGGSATLVKNRPYRNADGHFWRTAPSLSDIVKHIEILRQLCCSKKEGI